MSHTIELICAATQLDVERTIGEGDVMDIHVNIDNIGLLTKIGTTSVMSMLKDSPTRKVIISDVASLWLQRKQLVDFCHRRPCDIVLGCLLQDRKKIERVIGNIDKVVCIDAFTQDTLDVQELLLRLENDDICIDDFHRISAKADLTQTKEFTRMLIAAMYLDPGATFDPISTHMSNTLKVMAAIRYMQ